MTAFTLAATLLLAPQSSDAELLTWLKTAAVPIQTVAPGRGYKDLQPLKKTLAGVQIVGMGEATHGSREIFQMKHRMFEFLVEEMGFEVFALEASMAETVMMDRFVTQGMKDATYAAMASGFWTWSTAEVRDLLLWMRKYNLDPKHKKKLRVVGIDMQSQAGTTIYFQRALDSLGMDDEAVFWEDVSWEPPTRAQRKKMDDILNSLEPKIKAKFGDEELRLFRRVRLVFDQAVRNGESTQYRAARAAVLPFLADVMKNAEALEKESVGLDEDSRQGLSILTRLAKNEDFLKRADAPRIKKYAAALLANGAKYEHAAKVLELFALFAQDLDIINGSYREASMAENLEWVHKTYLPGKKIMVWAHNSHVANFSVPDTYASLGTNLTKKFGSKYYPIGFSFNQGSFRAIATGAQEVKDWAVEPARSDSADALFSRVGKPLFFVDFDRASGKTRDLLAQPRLTRNMGSGFNPADPNVHYRAISLSKFYRGMIFIDRVTAAKGL